MTILKIQGAPVRQKLGMILENKVVQKLKLEENVYNAKWSLKLRFLNKNKSSSFDAENRLWK